MVSVFGFTSIIILKCNGDLIRTFFFLLESCRPIPPIPFYTQYKYMYLIFYNSALCSKPCMLGNSTLCSKPCMFRQFCTMNPTWRKCVKLVSTTTESGKKLHVPIVKKRYENFGRRKPISPLPQLADYRFKSLCQPTTLFYAPPPLPLVVTNLPGQYSQLAELFDKITLLVHGQICTTFKIRSKCGISLKREHARVSLSPPQCSESSSTDCCSSQQPR